MHRFTRPAHRTPWARLPRLPSPPLPGHARTAQAPGSRRFPSTPAQASLASGTPAPSWKTELQNIYHTMPGGYRVSTHASNGSALCPRPQIHAEVHPSTPENGLYLQAVGVRSPWSAESTDPV